MKKHIAALLVLGLGLIISCQKERSFETSGTPSVGTLQSDVGGDCLPKTVAGAYISGTALVGTSNYIQVEVDVTTVGSYTIYTDTVNGYYFRATGVFTSTGANQVTLRGNGTPGLAGVNNFTIHYNLQTCTVPVTVLPAGTGPAVGTLGGQPNACAPIMVNGSYAVGVALTSGNSVQVQLNITTAGTYSITTDTVAGIWFAGSGAVTTGTTNITLSGNGSPTSGGTKTFTVKFGSSTCTFTVDVGAAGAGTLGGTGGACTPITVNGTYTAGTALTSGNTVQVQVNVTTPGVFSITTNTVNGYSFSFSGNLTTSGLVTLTGTGTPGAAGSNSFTVTLGASTCTFSVTVSGPTAGVGTLGGAGGTCTPANINGTYTAGTALTSANTVQVQVNVTTPGLFTINTNTVNGYSFSFSGNLAASGLVTLTGTGTPAAAGTNVFTVTLGASTCTFSVTVNPSGGGAATFTFDCSSANIDPDALFEGTLQLNCTNKIEFDVNVTALGTYNITTVATNGMTFSASGTFTVLGPQTVVLSGTGTPTTGGTTSIIPVNVTPPCSFSLTVEPNTSDVGWSFNVTNAPATTYKGQEDDAIMIPNPPGLLFGLAGSNTWGTDFFQMALSDVSGTINVGETYSTSAITGNQAAFQYDIGLSPYCADTFKADPSVSGVSMTFTITAHNPATMIISGTFTGTAKNLAGQTITIASGTFTTQFNPYHF